MTPELGRITAGLPRLDPSKRFQLDKQDAQRDRQIAVDSEAERKRDHAVREYRGKDLTELRVAVGTPLHSGVIISRLYELNPALTCKHHPFLNRFQVILKDKYICAFEDELSPQFEIYHTHEEEHVKGYGKDARLEKVKVLDSTTRGWVPLLILLIRKRLIPQTKTENLFGFVFGDIDVE
jgi:hypothetical protein